MAGKKQKEKSKNVKKSKGKSTKRGKFKKTKSEFENEIVDLNRKLAEETKRVKPVEEEFMTWEDKYEEKEKDLECVIDYLNAEYKIQESEVGSYDLKITRLENEMQEQKAHYESLIAKMQEENQGTLKDLEDQIYNMKATLTILGSQNNQMLQFRQDETQITSEEEELGAKIKEELYNIEKNYIRELDVKRKEFESIMLQIAENVSHEIDKNFELREKKYNHSAVVCKISELGEKYDKYTRKLEELKHHELEAKLSLEVVQEQIKLKQKKIKCSESSFCSLENLNLRAVTTICEDKEQQTDADEAISDESANLPNVLLKVVNAIEEMAHKALDNDIIEEESTVTSSFDEAEEVDNVEEQYNRREDVLTSMVEIIEDTLNGYFGKESDYYKMTKFVAAEGYKRRRLHVNRKYLIRHDFWRNWKLPANLQLAEIKREINLPLLDQ